MTPQEQFNVHVWYVLNKIHKDSLYVREGAEIKYILHPNYDEIEFLDSEKEENILKKLENEGVIDITDDGEEWVDPYRGGPYYKELVLKKAIKFNQRYQEYEKRFTVDKKELAEEKIPDTQIFKDLKLSVSKKDREIWVNNFLLSKPHATGKNMGLFEHLYERPEIEVRRSEMPDSLKNDLKGKSFGKILSDLNFKGETLRAFFPKRSSKISILFRKEVTLEKLREEGIKTNVLIKELELMHAKNNPE